jgi:hypothetical protein
MLLTNRHDQDFNKRLSSIAQSVTKTYDKLCFIYISLDFLTVFQDYPCCTMKCYGDDTCGVVIDQFARVYCKQCAKWDLVL